MRTPNRHLRTGLAPKGLGVVRVRIGTNSEQPSHPLGRGPIGLIEAPSRPPVVKTKPMFAPGLRNDRKALTVWLSGALVGELVDQPALDVPGGGEVLLVVGADALDSRLLDLRVAAVASLGVGDD